MHVNVLTEEFVFWSVFSYSWSAVWAFEWLLCLKNMPAVLRKTYTVKGNIEVHTLKTQICLFFILRPTSFNCLQGGKQIILCIHNSVNIPSLCGNSSLYPQIKDGHDGLDTPLLRLFSPAWCFSLSHFTVSLACRHKLFYSCHCNLKLFTSESKLSLSILFPFSCLRKPRWLTIFDRCDFGLAIICTVALHWPYLFTSA